MTLRASVFQKYALFMLFALCIIHKMYIDFRRTMFQPKTSFSKTSSKGPKTAQTEVGM